MNIDPGCMLAAVLVGTGATLITDLVALALKLVFRVPPPNFCLVGRWFMHMAGGVFSHENIAASAEKSGECAVGWIAHYVVGIAFSLMLVALASCDWLTSPTPAPALFVGTGTVLFPFLVMQPSFGLGIAASRAPGPAQARLRSLVTHVVFGIGLYVSALSLSPLVRGNVL